jgi:pimeloyl-ACP methyl ester carboxylesterase
MATGNGWMSEHVQVEGRSVHYRRSTGGSGVPLVHIHGFAISGAYLMPTARLLAGRWVNVVPDLPGYGLSERRDHVLDIPELAGAVLALLDALDLEQAVLVGNSMGCPIGLEVGPRGTRAGQPPRPGLARGRGAEPAAAPRTRPAGAGRGSREPADGPCRAAGPPEVRTDQRPAPVPRADPLPVPGTVAARACPYVGRPGWPGPTHAAPGPEFTRWAGSLPRTWRSRSSTGRRTR